MKLLHGNLLFAELFAALLLPARAAGGPEGKSTPASRKPLPSAEAIAALPPDGGPEFNRLIHEKSPYLLQHAGNPVDWFPWGAEAFEKARSEDKPVFLSIGYSTCHWCHVMEEESFENKDVAFLLNNDYVPIKVDREERPDLDAIYMNVTIGLTGAGGWPMTVIMTPEKIPFFAGTYFPRNERMGRPGMMELLPKIAQAWKTERKQIMSSAEEIARMMRETPLAAPERQPPDDGALRSAYRQLASRYDPQNGGFGMAPKFPTSHNLTLLLRCGKRFAGEDAVRMVETTLQKMRQGGIYDQIGFGFHRYSTDSSWLVPHFEKMLYDQALIAIASLEALQATGRAEYAATAEEIFAYVLRVMTDAQGGFFSAEDADSDGAEGKFYLWRAEELRAALGDAEARLFMKVFGVAEEGNFTDQGSAEKTGENILHLDANPAKLAELLGIPEDQLRLRMDASIAKVISLRETRPHPFKDDKVLADWNGLMIAAFALGAQVLDRPEYAAAAQKAADFILEEMRGEDGRLLHRYRQGEAGLTAHLDDYAFLVWGLLNLYETVFETKYLEAAIQLTRQMLDRFQDEKNGGFFLTADDAEPLPARPKEAYDGAVPSGNSVAAMNLLRLGRITADPKIEEKAEGVFKAFAKELNEGPASHAQMLNALDFALGPAFEIVIAGRLEAEDARAMLRTIRTMFIPNKVVVFRPDAPESEPPAITRLAPYTKEQVSRKGRATAYVCQNHVCKLPITDVEELRRALVSPAGESSRK